MSGAQGVSGGGPIRSVLVAGGGIVGWSAAAALKRRLPWLQVTIAPSPPPPDALADRLPCALPSIRAFHADLGLGEADAVGRTGGCVRLGTLFEGWAPGLPYVHAYGEVGAPLPGGSFHQHWLRAEADGGAAPFDRFCAAAALARAGRFQPAAAEPLGGYDYGYRLDVERYRGMMRALALHAGVVERPGVVADVRLRADGRFIESAVLDGGEALAADLFVDATGPAASLRRRLDDAWEDWSDLLPCDRMLTGEAAAAGPPDLLNRAVALAAGWRWRAEGAAATALGVAYAADALSDADAARLLAEAGAEQQDAPVAIRSGVRPEPWRGNCLAVGDAAVALEPLEWCPLHLAHSAIDRLICHWPDRDCAPVEIADVNRQALAEAERARDFVALHYAVADRPEPFWQGRTDRLPASLAHTLTQFRERGRLPFYEQETFDRSSWLAVLIGQGVRPRRTDPLLDAAPPALAARAMAGRLAALDRAVAAAPPHAAYLAQWSRRTPR